MLLPTNQMGTEVAVLRGLKTPEECGRKVEKLLLKGVKATALRIISTVCSQSQTDLAIGIKCRCYSLDPQVT